MTVGLALAYLWGATDDGEVNVVKPAAASPPAPAPVAAPVDSAETIALKKQVAVMEAAAIKSKAAELEAATLKGQASLKGQESAALESKVAELQGQLLRMQVRVPAPPPLAPRLPILPWRSCSSLRGSSAAVPLLTAPHTSRVVGGGERGCSVCRQAR